MAAVSDLLSMANGLARRYRVRGWDHEDLVQEAYMAMAAAPEGCCPSKLFARGRTRLSRIARRESQRACSPLPRQVEARRSEPARDAAEVVGKVLHQRDAGVVFGLFWLDLTTVEVAEQLGVTQARVYQILGRALDRLRPYFQGGGHHDGGDDDRTAAPGVGSEGGGPEGPGGRAPGQGGDEERGEGAAEAAPGPRRPASGVGTEADGVSQG